jgi:uncharacterized membrane-anchored protein YhcB (DUF1043 family)
MSPEVTAAWIAAGASIVTLIGSGIAQVIGFRSTRANTEQQIKATHKDTEDTLEQQRQQLDKALAEEREQLNQTLKAQSDQLDRTLAEQRTRTLNERFATAAEQLGNDKPAVRLAGVYAMAGLADDWEENRQTCVDVLCAYLRMPYEPDPGQDAPEPKRLAFQAIREVRHTVIRVISAHLRKGAAVSWQGLKLDFTGVVFDGGDFGGARFSGGTVNFNRAEFSGGKVDFSGAEFSGAWVDFNGARFSGGTVHFLRTQFSGGEIFFPWTEFSGATIDLYGAEFSGGAVSFAGAKFSAGRVSFIRAEFSAGTIYFGSAEFSGATVDFSDAEFSGGTVDFGEAEDWSFPPAFPWTGTPPSGVKLPRKQDQSKA